jgi:hypothetical protein
VTERSDDCFDPLACPHCEGLGIDFFSEDWSMCPHCEGTGERKLEREQK